jgi:hypothetical protein
MTLRPRNGRELEIRALNNEFRAPERFSLRFVASQRLPMFCSQRDHSKSMLQLGQAGAALSVAPSVIALPERVRAMPALRLPRDRECQQRDVAVRAWTRARRRKVGNYRRCAFQTPAQFPLSV